MSFNKTMLKRFHFSTVVRRSLKLAHFHEVELPKDFLLHGASKDFMKAFASCTVFLR